MTLPSRRRHERNAITGRPRLRPAPATLAGEAATLRLRSSRRFHDRHQNKRGPTDCASRRSAARECRKRFPGSTRSLCCRPLRQSRSPSPAQKQAYGRRPSRSGVCPRRNHTPFLPPRSCGAVGSDPQAANWTSAARSTAWRKCGLSSFAVRKSTGRPRSADSSASISANPRRPGTASGSNSTKRSTSLLAPSVLLSTEPNSARRRIRWLRHRCAKASLSHERTFIGTPAAPPVSPGSA